MSRFRGPVLAALLAGVSMQCLYEEPFNVQPDVNINPPAADPLRKRRPATFTATVIDPDQDPGSVRLEWFEREGPECPTSIRDARPQGLSPKLAKELTVEREKSGPFCVWVIATDQRGARDFAKHAAVVQNRPPKASVELPGATTIATGANPVPVPLYREVRLSNKSEDADEDPLEFRWKLRRPDGSEGSLMPCPGATTGEQCFSPAAPGLHEVSLVANDGEAESLPDTIMLAVGEDTPPCIRVTEPRHDLPRTVQSPEVGLTLRVVAIEDDGDPYPPPSDREGRGTFVWSWRRAGEASFGRLTGLPATRAELRFDATTFRTGDTIEVRVEYSDRVGDRKLHERCDREKRTCELETDCAQWVTWRVEYL